MNGTGGLEILFLLLFLIPVILFLLTLQNTLKRISVENRKMPPVQVWLTLVPFFGVIWQLVVVSRIADSLKLECDKSNIAIKENRPTFIIGTVYCFSYLIFLIPAVRTPASLLLMISWLLYWAEVSRYKRLLERSGGRPQNDLE